MPPDPLPGWPAGVRVLVCGGREYADWRTMSDQLWSIHHDMRIGVIIEGGAQGADAMAAHWARSNGVDVLRFTADWKTHGKAAGPMRNQRMLEDGQPNLVIAFPGGRGTADMVRRAKAAGVPVREV